MNKSKITILIFLLIFIILTCINPIYPNEQILQHIGTFFLLIVPFKDCKENKQTMFAFFTFCLFIFIHIIGARYIYSYVPYNEWFSVFFESKIVMTERNHFDRFVHLSFGVLFFPYLFELVNRNFVSSNFLKILITWSFIQSFSLVYEVFEWSLSIFMSSESANNYNGQQGDFWDAQKDMALAMLGSTFMSILYLLKTPKNN